MGSQKEIGIFRPVSTLIFSAICTFGLVSVASAQTCETYHWPEIDVAWDFLYDTDDYYVSRDYPIGDARAIPVLERMIGNFAVDSRWTWTQERMEAPGEKYPDDHMDYKHLKQCLKDLKKKVKGSGG